MESHLLQMRGLKLAKPIIEENKKGSHLLQMRGLKHNLLFLICLLKRRIFYRCVD